MISVIIPAHNESKYLNRTIERIFATAYVHPEVIVVDQGGNGDIDSRAVVIDPGKNVGERIAMNLAAKAATRPFLFRIDAHCDFEPPGWDNLLVECTGDKDITVAVLTALDQNFQRLKGHWYGFCRLVVSQDENGTPGLEAKWQKANRDHNSYAAVEPNMAFTGCGFLIRKAFYDEIGGADEELPAMGAIGEEFAIKAWLAGGKVQTRTNCVVGHVFGTGGYDTGGVKRAQQALFERYGDRYAEISARFPDWDEVTLIRTDQPGKVLRTVVVDRTDTHETKDNATGRLIRRRVETFRYVWVEDEHSDEKDWTEPQIEAKYAPLGVKIGEKVVHFDAEGKELT